MHETLNKFCTIFGIFLSFANLPSDVLKSEKNDKKYEKSDFFSFPRWFDLLKFHVFEKWKNQIQLQ